jgi:subfamily B ATP-binding cassette protein MsbA
MAGQNLRFLLSFALPYRPGLAASTLLMLGESVAGLAVPWLAGRLAADLIAQQATHVGGLLLAMLGLFALQALLKFGNGYLLGRTAERVLADLRIRVYDHLQSLPLGYYQQRRQGSILALLTTDAAVLSGFITGTLLSVIPLFLTLAGALVLMFRLDPPLTLTAATLVPLFYLLLKILGRRVRPLAQQLQEEHAAAVAIAEENLGMMPVIKTFTREPHESGRYRRQIRKILHLSEQQRRALTALGPSVQFIAGAGILAILWLATRRLQGGALSPAELVSFLLYAQLLTRPVSALADVYGQMQTARGALTRLLGVMHERPEPLAQLAQTLPPVRGGIEFRDLSFSYPGREPSLRGVNLQIPAGETIAVTGPNGAGKSTLVGLLLRLQEPATGRILIDGTDIATVSLHSLRGQIGVVPQHVLLFNGTVRDNIAYGRPEPTREAIEAAARAARAHDFITRLPQGYDTEIGDRGVRLSGGQQQRLALARALLKDPPILILDEATAMFDPEGEREFLQACGPVLERRTVLLITHRPASLALADRIVHIDEGILYEAPS